MGTYEWKIFGTSFREGQQNTLRVLCILNAASREEALKIARDYFGWKYVVDAVRCTEETTLDKWTEMAHKLEDLNSRTKLYLGWYLLGTIMKHERSRMENQLLDNCDRMRARTFYNKLEYLSDELKQELFAENLK